ncbi:protein piccolo-like [Eleginops maclovinus]|uniref:protein piccolo-like n=1 Tax=Eleginops maclovinus TaxID=56733 RepID=UPI003080FAB9
MVESSDSELTPSPKVQRKKLAVSNLSSSSEDIKTESADYDSMDDEEFIRKQIMGMGDEEKISLSEDEKVKNLADEEVIQEVELENASVTAKSTATATTQDSPERTTFKTALPVMKQRQSPDEEVESITESLSKGSSSVQVSSFTPGSSPTSASSIEEDSDSSPSHRKVSGDKHHRKGKHRQSTQPLPTIEDSSEDEKIKEVAKSRKDKDELKAQGPLPSPTASSTENLRQVSLTDETSRTSGSEYSASLESEPEAMRAVQRGRKPSITVIPYTPSDPYIEKHTVIKSLKSAEEAYEEIIQKTKAIPGESPPDIEPLYGGMAIEDYLYESLVEEPEIKIGESQEEDVYQETSSECLIKLRSPEEVYEEMMQKKRELMMIEQEFQQSQTAMGSSSSGASVTVPSLIAETCVVTMAMEETAVTGKMNMPLTFNEYSSELTLKKKKRPAPPRPSEPPKRSEITQCSSGEEEDDSLAEEYGVGISSDITPSDDSETKDDASISPPLAKTHSNSNISPRTYIYTLPHITNVSSNFTSYSGFQFGF